jgi:hypothetical protein
MEAICLSLRAYERFGFFSGAGRVRINGMFPAQDAAVDAKIASILDHAQKQQHE